MGRCVALVKEIRVSNSNTKGRWLYGWFWCYSLVVVAASACVYCSAAEVFPAAANSMPGVDGAYKAVKDSWLAEPIKWLVGILFCWRIYKVRSSWLAGSAVDACRIWYGQQDRQSGHFWPHSRWRRVLAWRRPSVALDQRQDHAISPSYSDRSVRLHLSCQGRPTLLPPLL